jgi:hypothetical protein
MRFAINIIVTLAIVGFTSCNQVNDSWKIADNPLLTEWASQIDPAKPWNVYPRPDMKRKEWMNLNGLWDYAITAKDDSAPLEWDGKILVPYPVESALSGVKKRITAEEKLWYRNVFQIPSDWNGKSLILNFEASDWETRVWINGSEAGLHHGGYNPFSFDISGFIGETKDIELIVSVWDPTDKGTQPRGKQVTNPGGIWYTPSSGIWQTVWIEPVNISHISSFRVIGSTEEKSITVKPEVANGDDQIIRMTVSAKGKIVGTDEKLQGAELKVVIDDAIFWTPDNPVLYDLKLELINQGKITDAVTSVAGIRKVSLGKTGDGITRILLNDEFVFQNGTLDQGFWPDGLYTPPTEEAMIYDLWMLKKMGFNMLRKHVKVENRVFYNWCDRIGLLVWQDMPNGDAHIWGEMPDIDRSSESDIQFRYEISRMINTHYNHPSIIIWVPFNEGWGQYNTEGITQFIKATDTTRLVISASGWTDRGTGDINDIHNYPDPRAPEHEQNRAIVLGEYGGLGLPVENHTWEQKNWGYRVMSDKNDLLDRYEKYFTEVRRLSSEKGLSAVVYTQTTDVETETNGLLTYDRKVDKMGSDNIWKAHLGYLPPYKVNRPSLFIDTFRLELSCVDSSAIIRFTTGNREPVSSSEEYDGPIAITETTTVSAKAWYNGGVSRTVRFEITKETPAEQPVIDTNTLQPGLSVSLYDGSFDRLPDFSTLTPSKSFASKQVTHTVAQKESMFALVFQGFIEIPENGVYGFAVASDDGSRLSVSGNELLVNDGIHGMTEKEGFIALGKGFHSFRLEYFQKSGGLGLTISIINPVGERTAIPELTFVHSTY